MLCMLTDTRKVALSFAMRCSQEGTTQETQVFMCDVCVPKYIYDTSVNTL
jgi:hypothetical protein